MKINWKIRWKNPNFIIQIMLAIGVPVLAYMGLTASDITTWSKLLEVILAAFLNPYVLGLVGVSVYNAINDPTTRGISDSNRALKYEEPNRDWG